MVAPPIATSRKSTPQHKAINSFRVPRSKINRQRGALRNPQQRDGLVASRINYRLKIPGQRFE
ncbi:MAG: hypothetical protein Rhirs2KO_15670 [Rhizobiaceae bacterium]